MGNKNCIIATVGILIIIKMMLFFSCEARCDFLTHKTFTFLHFSSIKPLQLYSEVFPDFSSIFLLK